MVAPFTNLKPKQPGWPYYPVEIDGLSYKVGFVDLFPSRPEEGRPYTFDFRVTGGLVPPGETEHVSIGGEKGGDIFIVEPTGRCIPCHRQKEMKERLGNLMAVLVNLVARYVHDKRKEPRP